MQSLIDKIQLGNAPPMEEVKDCPLCDSSESSFLFWNFDRFYHLPGKFGIVQCKNCSLVRLSPRPAKESLGFYYPQENYYSYQTPTVSIKNLSNRSFISRIREGIRQTVFDNLGYPVGKLSAWQKILQPLIVKLFSKQSTYGWGEKFPKYKKDGFALDIGCGNGSQLSYLKHHGWKVIGLDLSEQASEVAKKNFGIDVYVGELENLPYPPNTFDFIIMSHVLEHVTSPVETLKRVKELLKPDGVVYVEVPNYESFSRKLSREHWFAWETPRHLFMFSPQTLEQIFRESELKIDKINTKVENLLNWDNTYKIEEKLGEKLTSRPFVTGLDKFKISFLYYSAKLIHLFNKNSGDFVRGWAKKQNE